MFRAQPLGGLGEVELDDLGRAGADEEQLADVGAAGQQAVDLAVELGLGVGEAGEILFLEDRGGEARLGEDHDAGGRLQQMRAGAAADDEEECILHLAVEPDDACQPAEDLALPALAQDGQVATAGCGNGDGHAAIPAGAAPSRRAMRSFQMNWPALTTYAA